YLKYRDVPFDAVVAMSDISLEFLAQNREDLFVGTPVVFFTTTRTERPFANSTGFRSPADYVGTLMLAAHLQPALTHVFVVSGAGADDRPVEGALRARLRPDTSQVRD